MPRLDIDQFDKEPSVGDRVKVVGKVKEIEDGMVEISYDKVTIMNKRDRKDSDNKEDWEGDMIDESGGDGNMTTDEALNTYFSQNQ